MAIRIDWPTGDERGKRAAFNEGLSPGCTLPSCGATMSEVRKKAKEVQTDDIEIHFIEDAVVKGLVVFSKKEPFETKARSIEGLRPCLVSWIVTDALPSSLYFKKAEKEDAYRFFLSLLEHEDEMVRRLGAITLMSRFLEEERLGELLPSITAVEAESHLLKMAIAWFMATSYTKFPDETAPFFKALSPEVCRMAKQKCRDSRRISQEAKERLRSL